MNVSDFLLQRLSAGGVRRVFGYPGDGINGLMGAFNRNDHGLRFIQTRHEEMAAFMACAHAMFTGEVGVCMLVGSEWTCAIALEATLRLVDNPPERIVVVLSYADISAAADHVAEVGEFEPLAVEGMDRILYDHVRDKHMPQQKYLDILPEGQGWLLIELGSHDRDELRERATRLIRKLRDLPDAPRQAKLVEAANERAHLWKVREAGLGATAFVPGRPDAWPGFEDSAVPPARLGAYMRELRALFDRYDYHPSLYGHFRLRLRAFVAWTSISRARRGSPAIARPCSRAEAVAGGRAAAPGSDLAQVAGGRSGTVEGER